MQVVQGSSCTVSDFPSALLDLVTYWNITFAPVLTSVVLGFNSHPTTLKLFWFKCHRRMNHCLTLRCVIHLFLVGRSPLRYRRLSFTANIFSHTWYILLELLWSTSSSHFLFVSYCGSGGECFFFFLKQCSRCFLLYFSIMTKFEIKAGKMFHF